MGDNYKPIFIVSGAALAIGAIIYFLKKNNSITLPPAGPVPLPVSTEPNSNPSVYKIQPIAQLKPAEASGWKPMPQFQVNTNSTTDKWYALQHAQDTKYCQNVDINELMVGLKKGANAQVLSSLIQKYGLQSTGASTFPDGVNFYTYHVPNSSREKVLQIVNEAKLNNQIEYAEPSAIISAL